MERAHRAAVSTFYAPGAWGDRVTLDAAAAHHAQVKRLQEGDPVRLTSGDGRRAGGTIVELARSRAVVELGAAPVELVRRPPRIELLAPVGDRDRMLWLAEKSVELGVSGWRPVVYRRSRSVTPRGEGDAFREKVRLRMIGALEQSGGAWLPEQHAESSPDVARAARGELAGILLDVSGPPLGELAPALQGGCMLALGPEGGLDDDERESFLADGWRAASLGANVLRFETAGIAALAILRSHLR